MYHNFIFDLYGTLVDIHTNEKKLPSGKGSRCSIPSRVLPIRGGN